MVIVREIIEQFVFELSCTAFLASVGSSSLFLPFVTEMKLRRYDFFRDNAYSPLRSCEHFRSAFLPLQQFSFISAA